MKKLAIRCSSTRKTLNRFLAFLVLTHVVSAGFPPLYFTVLALTIVAGIYCANKRYQQKKQGLDKAAESIPKAPKASAIPILPASIPAGKTTGVPAEGNSPIAISFGLKFLTGKTRETPEGIGLQSYSNVKPVSFAAE